ncbi:MAG TPA: type II CAAX endopeptidase family protein [Flavitalea sp.]|nr:type II CAAX endopeptidase family protein [Flavitalea sp.]
MASRKERPAMIEKGWIKALLLVLIYSVVSISAGSFISSIHLWFLVSAILALVFVYFFRVFIDRRSFVSLGFRVAMIYPDILIGVLIAAAVVCAGAVIIFLFRGFEWTSVYLEGWDLATAFGSILLVSFSEELVYRGYVLRNLLKSFNKWLALIISSVLFTMVHLTNPGIPLIGIINIFLGGLVMGIAFIYSRNLWMPVGFHFGWNLFQGPLLGFPVSGFSFDSLLTMERDPGLPAISGGEFGFEASLICTLLLLVLCGAAFRRIRNLQPAM